MAAQTVIIAKAAQKAQQIASQKSEELFKYDFLGLTQKLAIYFVFA